MARRWQKSDARLISAATAVANVVVIVMEITRDRESETARDQRVTAIFLPRSRCPKAMAGMSRPAAAVPFATVAVRSEAAVSVTLLSMPHRWIDSVANGFSPAQSVFLALVNALGYG